MRLFFENYETYGIRKVRGTINYNN